MFDLPLDLDHEPADLAEAKEMLRRAKRELSHWQKMYECAQNANALRQAAIDGCDAT